MKSVNRWKALWERELSPKRARNNLFKILAGVLLAGGLYALLLTLTDLRIPCLVYEQTGLLCPGCGVTHMALALLRGDPLGAFFYHPVLFVLLLLWCALAILVLLGRPALVRKPAFLYGGLFLSLLALVVFGVVRNVI